jgi:hypothetical protein
LLPENNKVPPDALSYHSYKPPGALAVTDAVFPAQIVAPLTVGLVGIGFTVTVTAVLLLLQLDTVVST